MRVVLKPCSKGSKYIDTFFAPNLQLSSEKNLRKTIKALLNLSTNSQFDPAQVSAAVNTVSNWERERTNEKSCSPRRVALLSSMIHKVKWHPIDNAASKEGPSAEWAIQLSRYVGISYSDSSRISECLIIVASYLAYLWGNCVEKQLCAISSHIKAIRLSPVT